MKPIDITCEQHIAASPERVFALVTDVEHASRWSSSVGRTTVTSAGPFGEGSAFVEEATLVGRPIRTEKVVTRFEPPSRYREEARGGLLPHTIEFELRPAPGGATDLRMRLEARPGRALGLVGPLLRRGLARQVRQDLRALAELAPERPDP